MPSATEDTVTSIIKKELENRGVATDILIKLQTPKGIRKPDLYCRNGGNYVIEAKIKERDYLNVLGKVYDEYLKYYDVLDLAGGFALLYPEELTRIPIEDLRTQVYQVTFRGYAIFSPVDTHRNTSPLPTGKLDVILDRLAEIILEPMEIEADIDFLIQSFRESTKLLTDGLKSITGNQFLEVFGGRNIFENILQYEEEAYPLESLRVGTAYLLINQIIFYHILSKKKPQKYPEIDTTALEEPNDLNGYFEKVLEENYEVVFSYDLASWFLRGYFDKLKEIINAIKALSLEKINNDVLGRIFHDTIPYEDRKFAAAFYTNIFAAKLLAKLAVRDYSAKVADFACGSGGLLVGAYNRKRELITNQSITFTEDHHKSFLEEDILGVDVMVFAAHLAAMHLALQSPEYFTNHVNVSIWDSTELSPKSTILGIADREYTIRGQRSLDHYAPRSKRKKGTASLKKGKKPKPIKLHKFDAVLMNPPFTRQERLPEEYKERLTSRFEDYRSYLDGQMSFFNYFILLGDRFLNKGGVLAFVLPATFLSVESSRKVREFLVDRYDIEYIIANSEELNFSDSTWKREVLIVARKKVIDFVVDGYDPKDIKYQKVYKIQSGKNPLEKNKATEAYFKWLENKKSFVNLISDLDYKNARISLEKIKRRYEKLTLDESEMQQIMIELYNRHYNEDLNTYTKTVKRFHTNYLRNLESEIEGENNKFTSITIIPKLPTSEQEVEEIYEAILKFRESDALSSNLLGYNVKFKALKKSLKNWYKYITFEDIKTFELWETLTENNEYLIGFRSLIRNRKKSKKISLKRGIETAKGMNVQYTMILSDESRAVSGKDAWIVKKIDKLKKEGESEEEWVIHVKNRFNERVELKVPSASVVEAIRSLSNQPSMDISDVRDYVVVRGFDNVKDFFERKPELVGILEKWERYVLNRQGNLIIMRRIFLPAPGTKFLAFYSKNPIAPPGVCWISSGFEEISAQIIVLWFNSGLHLFQMLYKRIEDVWINVHQYVLDDYYVPNIDKISNGEKQTLGELFHKVSEEQGLSIYDQALNNFKSKRKIDEAFLRLFGFADSEISEYLDKLYPMMTKKIQSLFDQMHSRKS